MSLVLGILYEANSTCLTNLDSKSEYTEKLHIY